MSDSTGHDGTGGTGHRGRGPNRSGVLAGGAVALAVALLAVAGVRGSGAPSAADPPHRAAVSSVTRACPGFGTDEVQDQTIASAAIAQSEGTQSKGTQSEDMGQTSAVRLPGGKQVDGLAPESRGRWATQEVSADRAHAVLLSAEDGAAPGAVAFGATQADDSLGAGLAISGCPQPEQEHWFLGAGSSREHQSTIVLTNPTDSPAVVDLSLYGRQGPLEAAREAISVDPRSVERVELRDLAPGESNLAVHASVTRGSVSVSTLDVVTEESPGGSEWIPSAQPPSRQQTAVGVGDGERSLVVANPSERTATVDVRILGRDGTFTAEDLEQIEVEPGAVAVTDVPSRVGSKRLGIGLSSDQPVTAGVRTTSDSTDDYGYAVARDPLDGTAAMPLRIGETVSATDAELLLTGRRDSDATVTVTGYDRKGNAHGEVEVTVPAGTTVSFDPTDEQWSGTSPSDLAYLTVEPGGTAPSAAAVYETSDGMSVLPLHAAPSTVPAPAAEPSS